MMQGAMCSLWAEHPSGQRGRLRPQGRTALEIEKKRPGRLEHMLCTWGGQKGHEEKRAVANTSVAWARQAPAINTHGHNPSSFPS